MLGVVSIEPALGAVGKFFGLCFLATVRWTRSLGADGDLVIQNATSHAPHFLGEGSLEVCCGG